jgi:hypothetical protein
MISEILMLSPGIRAGEIELDADTIVWKTAVETADGQALETAVLVAVDNLVKGLKADGSWAKMKTAGVLCGPRTLAGALVPLVGNAIETVGASFVAGDYNRKTGIKNGSDRYLRIDRDNAAEPDGDRHWSTWATELADAASNAIQVTFPTDDGTSNRSTAFRNNVTPTTVTVSANGGVVTLTNAFNANNMFGAATLGTPTLDRKGVAGGKDGTSTTSLGPARAGKFHLGFNPTGSVHFLNRYSWFSVGEHVDIIALRSRVSAFMGAIGAAAI